MLDEQKISDAYETIAGLAVSPERVRARIDARARVHRQRRLLLAGAGAATVAVAVGVPLVNRRRPVLPAAGTPDVPLLEVPLQYTPSWLPDGFTERYRSVRFDTETGPLPNVWAGGGMGATRMWLPPGIRYRTGGPAPESLRLMIDEPLGDEKGEPVEISGNPGTLRTSGDTVYVSWRPGPNSRNMIVSAHRMADPVTVALRVARSTIHTSALMNVTMRSPSVPEQVAGQTTATVFPTEDGWQQSLTHSSSDGRRSCEIVARTSPPPVAATYRLTRPDGIDLHLAGGSAITGPEARRMLEQVICDPPDLSWVGDR